MDTNAHNTVTGNGERVLTVSRKAKGIFWDPLFLEIRFYLWRFGNFVPTGCVPSDTDGSKLHIIITSLFPKN